MAYRCTQNLSVTRQLQNKILLYKRQVGIIVNPFFFGLSVSVCMLHNERSLKKYIYDFSERKLIKREGKWESQKKKLPQMKSDRKIITFSFPLIERLRLKVTKNYTYKYAYLFVFM